MRGLSDVLQNTRVDFEGLCASEQEETGRSYCVADVDILPFCIVIVVLLHVSVDEG
jgi:hypothetical protein